MRRKLFTMIFVCIFFIVVSFFVVKTLCKGKASGRIIITVCDGFSSEPIKNARVVIPELNKVMYTNENGKTSEITVPLSIDKHYNKIKKQDYGIVTIIVYKDGYLPYALFYAHIYKDKLRTPQILLFEDDGGEPFIVIESPKKDWANDVIKKYS